MSLKDENPSPLAELEGKSYFRQLWSIAWPSSISMLLFTMFDLVNIKWIGFLGTEPVAAASLVGNLIGSVWGVMSILFTGALALFARSLGAGDKPGLRNSFQHTMVLSVVFGLLIAAPCAVFAPEILGFFHLKPGVYDLALPYLRIFSIAFFALFIEIPFWTIWIARGRTRLLLGCNASAVALNLVLDPVMIFPKGRFLVGTLGMGVTGAAIASVISEFFLFALLFLLSRREDFPVKKPLLSGLTISWKENYRILRIGIPGSIAVISRPLSTLMLQRFISSFGPAAIAGFGIGLRWVGLNWIFLQGLSNAISSLVGRYLGGQKVEEAGAMMRRAFAIGVALQVLTSALFFTFAPQLIRIMEPSPDTVRAGTAFIRWLALAMLFSSSGDISRAALNGAGNTNPGMAFSIVGHWLVKIPLAWLLAFPLAMGIEGIWQGTAAALTVEALLLLFWYSRGKWKSHKI
jgi:putative MATE family efflux protein